jgi:fructose-bisphosphate aldolase class II
MTAIQSRLHLGHDGRLAEGRRQDTGRLWDYNVGITKPVTDMAHLGGISVEGELGVLGSLETGEGEKEDGHGAKASSATTSFSPIRMRR